MCCMRLSGNTGCKNDVKIAILAPITQLCRAVSLQLRHVSTTGKKMLSSNTSSTCPRNMVNFGPLMAKIGLGVWGTRATNFNGFRVLAALLHGTLAKLCGVEQRAPPIFGRAAIALGTGQHSSVKFTLTTC